MAKVKSWALDGDWSKDPNWIEKSSGRDSPLAKEMNLMIPIGETNRWSEEYDADGYLTGMPPLRQMPEKCDRSCEPNDGKGDKITIGIPEGLDLRTVPKIPRQGRVETGGCLLVPAIRKSDHAR